MYGGGSLAEDRGDRETAKTAPEGRYLENCRARVNKNGKVCSGGQGWPLWRTGVPLLGLEISAGQAFQWAEFFKPGLFRWARLIPVTHQFLN